MQLIYRGVEYTANPAPIENQRSQLIGKYRGAAIKLRNAVAKLAGTSPAVSLKYRGVCYGANWEQAPEPLQPVTTVAESSERLLNERQLIAQQRANGQHRQLSALARFEQAIGIPAWSYPLAANRPTAMN